MHSSLDRLSTKCWISSHSEVEQVCCWSRSRWHLFTQDTFGVLPTYHTLTGGGDQKIERNDEEDDAVTFVGSSSLACNAESKSNSQVLYLNTTLARTSISLEAQDDDLAGLQKQTTPVTVRRGSEAHVLIRSLNGDGFIVYRNNCTQGVMPVLLT